MSTSFRHEPISMLTEADVERLMRDGSADSRLDVLNKVSHHYNADEFSQRERAVAEQIFRIIMKDTQIQVRETLVQRIRNNPDIPRDIALHLALDHERVAVPLLEVSDVLSDADLVKVIESTRDISKLLAITRRPTVSQRVSGVLVETNYPNVINALLDNPGADISEHSITHITENFSEDPRVLESMVARTILPLTVVEKLVARVTESIARELKEKYHLSDAQIRKETSGAREDITLKLMEKDQDSAAVEALVRQLYDEQRLTPSIVMTALCRGQLHFFIHAAARLARIPVINAEKLVIDQSGLGFRSLYERTEMPASMFEAVQLLLKVVQELEGGEAVPGSLLYANRAVERMLAAAGNREVENLPYLMALVRQNVHRS